MKNWILVALTGVMLSGCVASQIAPEEGVLRSARIISVVPIESPPLLLHPNSEEEKAAIAALMRSATSPAAAAAPSMSGPGAALAQSAAPLALAPPVALQRGATTLTTIGGMLMLLEAASSGKETPGGGSVVPGDSSETWVPSVEFAKTAVSLLQRRETLDVRMIDGYVKLPIADRSITWHLENWMAPIRHWYGSDAPGVDYASLGSGKADLILEVGVLNYEYAFDRLILQVWVRLIDPNTRQVLGRARSFEQSKTQPLAPLLQNDAEGMKRLVLEVGNRLLAKCLTDVRLTSR